MKIEYNNSLPIFRVHVLKFNKKRFVLKEIGARKLPESEMRTLQLPIY